MDIRPHFLDKITKTYYLLDTGSFVTSTPRAEGDALRPDLALQAANNSHIPCYGYREIELQINRKKFKIQAAITDIAKPIIGFDFIKKFRLNQEWEGDTYMLCDPKAQIRTPLHFAALPHMSVPSTIAVSSLQNASPSAGIDSVVFQISCIKKLKSVKEENLEELEKIDQKYQKLISDYSDLLEPNFSDKPNKQGVQHFIQTNDQSPCRAKPRKLMKGSPKEVEGKRNWQELVDLGIVEPVDVSNPTTWSSALHLQAKPSGGWRCCGDFRELNSKTELDKFPLPVLRDFSQKLRNAKVFSRVDMKLAFHHIDVAVQDRHKTTTLTPWGAYQWRKLPMGLANAAQSYQRWMSAILGDMEHVFCYLDDFLIYTETEEEHMQVLEELFKRLREAGLTLALKKCKFGQSSIEFLGYMVSPSGVAPLPKKVEAIAKYPEPERQKDLLAYLGCLNYFRSCLGSLKISGTDKNCAEILQPLYSVATASDIKTNNQFQEIWKASPNLQKAFENSKKLLMNATALAHPDPNAL